MSTRSLAFAIVAALMSAPNLVGAEGDPFSQAVRPLLEKYCLRCHSEEKPQGEVRLSAFAAAADVEKDVETWQRVWEVLHSQAMPPQDPSPTAAERKQMADAIAALLRRFTSDGRLDPGHVVMRRLNQAEYNNTVLDLFGVYRSTHYYDPARGMPEEVRVVLHREYRRTVVPLPPDDVGYGFTNVGEVLSLPPFLMEKYLAAARQVVDQLGAEGKAFGRRGRVADSPQGAQSLIADFGRRAFRRPMTDEELERYLALYRLAEERGEPFSEAIKVPMQAMLVSPHFLFKAEQGVAEEERDGVRPLDNYELATRLSYFLWSTMPDEELLRLAEQGRLRDPVVLEAQTRRMLQHRFSKELSEQFGQQWLGVAGIRGAMPFPDLYPDFYKLKLLPHAMQLEAMLLFETIVVEDRSVLEFIDPGFTWLNGTMNGFYDIDPERASDRNSGLFWKRYELADPRRGGILTMAAPLLATSLSTRTSPVNRGQWVLETILGTPAPPPPQNVPDLENAPAAKADMSLRERLALHRADAACASCHRRMDPIGFGLENYDAIGAWRDEVQSQPIDAAGTLTDGAAFDGPADLKKLLVTQYKDEFLRCLTGKLMTYALGRKLARDDMAAIDQIVAQLPDEDYRFSAVVVGIVRSDAFRYLRVDMPDEREKP